MTPAIRRAFIDVPGGQVHLRMAGEPRSGVPLVMLHPSPGSSKMLEPLIRRFAATRPVLAPDTLGNGDSMAPAEPDPPLESFVAGHLAAIDALGLQRFDLYGSHTGGNLAAEIAIRRPAQVGHLILDGMSLYSDAQRADMLAHHAPPITLSADGSHLAWVWRLVHDGYVYWPWYRNDDAHRRHIPLPPASVLHDKAVEVLKAATSYHLSYRAAIGYDKRPRLPLVAVPTLLACAGTDMLLEYLDAVAALMPTAEKRITPGTGNDADADATVGIMTDFLGR